MPKFARLLFRIAGLFVIAGLVFALAATALAQTGEAGTVYTLRSVFMRAGPSMAYHVVATLAGGEQLSVLGQEGNWYQVQRADGASGYVYGSFLTSVPPGTGGGAGSGLGAPLVSRPAESNTLAVVTAPALNVREGPGLNFRVVGTVKAGETVAVLAREVQWRLIQTAGGLRGWVNSIHLSSSITPVINLSGLNVTGGVTAGPALGGSLAIRSVVFDHAVRDALRPGGAIVTIRIEFTGGAGPFAISSDGFAKASGLIAATRNEGSITVGTLLFTETSECGGTMVHTVTVTAANGQSASQGYYVSPVVCPN